MAAVIALRPARAEPTSSPTQLVRIVGMREEATDVLSLELRPAGNGTPAFEPGAHLELHLPGGLRRAYSLVNAPGEAHCYRIAVHRHPESRGGSRTLHELLRVGDMVQVGAPRNLFPLANDGRPCVLIAGGIGITPLWAMAQRLAAEGRDWQLHYAARERGRAAFLDALLALDARRVHAYFDGEPGGRILDLAEVVTSVDPRAHLYCCGPQRMLQAFETATRCHDPARVHLERFGGEASPQGAGEQAAFDVVLARSGRTVRVEGGCTILDALTAAGIDAPSSCREGFCGTCETRVIEGIPEHADSVLSAAERNAGRSMMICCSRSRTNSLVLDL